MVEESETSVAAAQCMKKKLVSDIQTFNITQGPAKTLSSPASIAGDDRKRSLGRIAVEAERATPTYSDPTVGNCTSGEIERWQSSLLTAL